MDPNKIRSNIIAIPRLYKRLFVMIVDCIIAIFSVWFAFYLRIGIFIPLSERVNEYYAVPACVLAIVIFLPIFLFFKLYNEIFRFSGTQTIFTVIKAVSLYIAIYAIIFAVISVDGVPRTIGIIQPVIFLILIICSRYFALFWLGDMNINQSKQNKKTRALIYGADKDGRELMTALSDNSDINIVGFVDDQTKLQNNNINGLSVYNPLDIDKIITKKNINEIFIVLSRINRRRRNEIIHLLKGRNIKIRTLPSLSELAQGQINIDDINNLSIEDILGRDPVKPDSKLMQHDITNKVVLVTGAGGSIGSEICRQIYKQKPKKIILFEQNEFSLYTIFEELKKYADKNRNHIELIPLLGSVTDEIMIKRLLIEIKPETIYHAAAYKHVPLVERNKFEGLKNNVFGTLVLAEAAITAGVRKFILISSDKAVRPPNIMGASKRIAEMILQALSENQKKTIFAIVRFGNVLGSSGSVVPLFKSQIKSGGPVTVTHPKITRFFMTIFEAAELVIQTGAIVSIKKKQGYSSPIYLLDMGKPIKIYNLAKLMIELSGLTVFDKISRKGDIEIKFTGIRKGEKLYEELHISKEICKTSHPKIKYVNEEFLVWPELKKYLTNMTQAINNNNLKLVIESIETLVIGFKNKQ